jgi:DNA-binding transcriptional LysR family regulator
MDRLTAAEVFVRIAEKGSLTAAAEALAMSRAMVTRHLSQMEQWTGARLLHRTTRRQSLTEAGRETLARCRRMLDTAAEMALAANVPADAPHAAPLRGSLRVACAPWLAQDGLAATVAEFLSRHPQVTIDLQIGARPVNLIDERIDLAIRVTNDLDPNLIARPLGRCESVICAAPSYLAAHGSPRSAQDLSRHNCLTYAYFGKSLWAFDSTGDRAGERLTVPVGGNLSANDSQVLLAAAIAGAGITMQPLVSAREPIARGQLVALLPDAVPLALGVYGLYASRRLMPAALRALLDLLVQRWADPGNGLGDVPAGPPLTRTI